MPALFEIGGHTYAAPWLFVWHCPEDPDHKRQTAECLQRQRLEIAQRNGLTLWFLGGNLDGKPEPRRTGRGARQINLFTQYGETKKGRYDKAGRPTNKFMRRFSSGENANGVWDNMVRVLEDNS